MPPSTAAPSIAITTLREAQSAWASVSLRERLRVLRRLRAFMAQHALPLAHSVRLPQRPEVAVTLASEVMPLAEACRFLEKNAGSILCRQKHTARGQALWLRGHHLEIHHEPLGVVLILGPSNYPLFLPGVQALQALAAGNAVIVKPGAGGLACMTLLGELLHQAGLPTSLFTVLPESVEAAQAALKLPPDKVFLTGSAATGQIVLHGLGDTLTPIVMELSGCDAVFVLEDADLDGVVKAVTFGLTLNGSATCIAPRRLFVHQSLVDTLTPRLVDAFCDIAPIPLPAPVSHQVVSLVEEAIQQGAKPLCWFPPVDHRLKPALLGHAGPSMRLLQSDVFAPVLAMVTVRDAPHALALSHACPYALGATVFGSSDAARAMAQQVDAGCVVINDMIAPTADPRLPFAGRHRSGFGVTRGALGLLAMTQPKAIVVSRGKFKPHLQPPRADDAAILQAYLQWSHADGWRKRGSALRNLLRTLLTRRPEVHPLTSGVSHHLPVGPGLSGPEASTENRPCHTSGRIHP